MSKKNRDDANGWTHVGETWASGQVWSCDNCGREKVTELIRNPEPTPERHDCWGSENTGKSDRRQR